MDSNLPVKTVAGIFKDEAAAAQALEQLIEEHFDVETEVSLIASRHHDREDVPIREDFHVGRLATIGAAIGALLAAAGVTVVGLTFGPISLIAAGPVVAALEGAYAGGAIGFAMGALVSIDLVEPEAVFYAAHIHEGVVWVGVRAGEARAERARQILTEAGAKHFMDHRPEVVDRSTKEAAHRG
jgi:hypothetical protein